MVLPCPLPTCCAAPPNKHTDCFLAVMMVCGFVLAWQRFYDEDKAIDEEMKNVV